VGHKLWRSRLNNGEKIALALVFGSGVLIWSLVAFTVIGLYTLPPPVHGIAPPLDGHTSMAHLFSTPTPSLVPQPTDTPTATQTSTATPTPVPTPTPRGGPPTLVDNDTIVIAVLGMDNPQKSTLWRTDSILLVFINGKAQKIGILSVPRDLWVVIPGYGSNRINTVDSLGARVHYPGGGPALLDQTLRYNLDVPIDHYVRVDFNGFVRIVDAMGGVTVNVEKPLRDMQYTQLDLQAGVQHFDGRTALDYCRSRITTSDFDRSQRQQQVIMALWKKVLTPGTLVQAPKLWAEFSDAFETDLTMAEAVRLAYVVNSMGPDNVRMEHLGYDTARPWTSPGGAQVLLPQTRAIQQIILDLLAPSE
jgi:LCP family protein required for cell wall assembly